MVALRGRRGVLLGVRLGGRGEGVQGFGQGDDAHVAALDHHLRQVTGLSVAQGVPLEGQPQHGVLPVGHLFGTAPHGLHLILRVGGGGLILPELGL